jgi:hypothetical protein
VLLIHPPPGEATTKKYPATMHGAFDSGLREAARIMAQLGDVRHAAWKQQQQQHQGEGHKGYAGSKGKSSRLDAAAEEAGRRLVKLAEQLTAVSSWRWWGRHGIRSYKHRLKTA